MIGPDSADTGAYFSPAPIMLVEDNEDDLELVRRSFRHHNMRSELVIATDGRQALDMLAPHGRFGSELPALVLLDLRLPIVDGLEVLREMHADPRTKNVPVVVLTSSPDEWDRLQSLGHGAVGYVAKPLDFKGLARAVQLSGCSLGLASAEPASCV